MSQAPSQLTLAIAQHPAIHCSSFESYSQLQQQRVSDAVSQGAELLCFAEYGALELTGQWPKATFQQQIQQLQLQVDPFCRLFQQLAVAHKISIVAPGIVVETDLGMLHRSYVFSEKGLCDFQDKIHSTRLEKSLNLSNSLNLKIFEHNGIKFAVVICYDSEFPTQSRALQQAGAELILVPSCTDSVAGFERVRMSCRARALENQLPVAQAVINNQNFPATSFNQLIDQSLGHAGVYAWPDIGLPDDGVLASGKALLDNHTDSNWLVKTINLKKISSVRRHGQVAVAQDWDFLFITPEQ
ncbi:nitrilase-related carbon-nitrogen hydrolase [Pelagibaculum spongiae]|uniref:CN hydrolase domain-containing protein n=1 Tax=Pelagibaculum spongiae TaxID=2080658 RepID=A0A2V1H142_9GAMM|nr:nitrilase-related carbon-nitrogen hydrolase [Pelagibaculum spongiae]PVZ68300.1 hypothetical protein DC094_13510 [Pelagibaculum spongiae]